MRHFVGILIGLSASAAWAQMPPPLTASAAEKIIAGCKARAADMAQAQAIVVMDPGGATVASLRMDRVRAGAMAFASSKAKAVADWGFATSEMAEGAKSYPGFAFAPSVVTVPGGVPAYSADGRTFVAAIGVSGEDPADDVACARAGIVAAGLKTERAK